MTNGFSDKVFVGTQKALVSNALLPPESLDIQVSVKKKHWITTSTKIRGAAGALDFYSLLSTLLQ
jgi:hypothetical protein